MTVPRLDVIPPTTTGLAPSAELRLTPAVEPFALRAARLLAAIAAELAVLRAPPPVAHADPLLAALAEARTQGRIQWLEARAEEMRGMVGVSEGRVGAAAER